MGFVQGSFFIGFLFILNCGFCVFAQESSNEERKVYVVYLGERQHDDPDLVAESHHRMLESVFESAEAARDSITTITTGFPGLQPGLQALKLRNFQVSPDRKVELLGTRVYDYLGLSPSLPNGILHDTNMGSELVIGFIDSGIWPEAPVFNDEGFGPIPKHWKGTCVAGEDFIPEKHCNKKLVGAKYFFDGLNKNGKIAERDFLSARGSTEHGTLTASLAAASFVPNASSYGLGRGVFRGGAPKARIAMYKVIWQGDNLGNNGIANIAKAFDEAIKDGVDVVSISIAPNRTPIDPFTAFGENIEIGSFHAVTKGIPVITGSGNSGPDAYSVSSLAPWLLTVGGTNLDRAFYVDMTFGNNVTIMGMAIYKKLKEVSADLVYVEDWRAMPTGVEGKVVLIFVKADSDVISAVIAPLGAVGVIIARSTDYQALDVSWDPVVYVDFEVGTKIRQYIRSSSSPTIKISAGKTIVGRPIPTVVGDFSSRGPNPVSPAILKPDIAAPGMMVIGATTEAEPHITTGYSVSQGTSFSTPIVASIVVLLKSLHPDWSPAALKSAIMTTAWKTDPYGEPIFAEGLPRKLADAFDYGAGLINAERARDPGLVYDMNLDDYIHYFCASGYNDTSITVLTGKQTICGTPLPSILDVNYPAITIPDLKDEVTLTRTLTNVGPVDSVYKAVFEPPRGVKIAVEPETLVFDSSKKKLGFKVRVSTSHKSNTGYFFGIFTWTDGTRNVTIPLTVRTRV